MSKKNLYGGLIVGLILVMLAVGLFMQTRPTRTPGSRFGPDRIALIRIEGIIAGGRGGASFLGAVAGAEDVIQQISVAKEDPQVKAVVLRINSPGGTPAASEEIGREVEKLAKTQKPVVASLGDTAASGAYWVACQADRIVANATTTTGSIGVITQINSYEEMFEKIGIDTTIIKSGEYKDLGTTSRDPSEEEIEILQLLVDDIFERFVDTVAKGRDMEIERVMALSDGRIFTGRQALELGLVDDIGNLLEALDIAAGEAGIIGPYTIKEYRRTTVWDMFFMQGADLLNIKRGQQEIILPHLLLLHDTKRPR